MNKNEFISALESRIKKYPDYKEIIDYYNELIQDKIDMNYMTEDEAVASLGSLDEICKNIEEQRAQVKDEKEEVRAAIKEENNKTEANQPRRMSGGKRFVYVLWTIATVFMAIFSIIVLIVAIASMVGSIAGMIASATIIATSTSIASFYFGIGLFVFGITIIGVHYAGVLVKFVFKNRPRWTNNVRKGLEGE